jgi:hypothetical protein
MRTSTFIRIYMPHILGIFSDSSFFSILMHLLYANTHMPGKSSGGVQALDALQARLESKYSLLLWSQWKAHEEVVKNLIAHLRRLESEELN